MSTKTYSLLKGSRVRLTKLDACGRPIYGDDTSATSSGFITVSLTANTTESDEINVTNAAGETCVYEAAETSLTGYAAEIAFCNVDPELFAIATNQSPYLNAAGDVIGFAVETGAEASTFALELWMGVAGSGDSCDNPDAQGEYGYVLLPFVKGGIVGDMEFGNAATTFTITGANSKDGARWGVGPYNVILDGANPAKLPTALSRKTHFLSILVDVAPPAAASGARPVLDPSAEGLTSIAATATGATASVAILPNDVLSPVWIDWGDGEWSYEDDTLATATHTYAASGTYIIKASTNGTWVQDDITVTVP